MDVTVPIGAWASRGDCLDLDPDLFFDTNTTIESSTLARTVCAHCPVRLDCLLYAVQACISDGIFGGTTADFRRRMRSYFFVSGIRPTIHTIAEAEALFAGMTKVEQKRLIAQIRTTRGRHAG